MYIIYSSSTISFFVDSSFFIPSFLLKIPQSFIHNFHVRSFSFSSYSTFFVDNFEIVFDIFQMVGLDGLFETLFFMIHELLSR